MASQKTKFTVGLFLAGGLAIAVLSAVWLGMTKFLMKGTHYVTYFNESVQGLDKDSPVKYRGVPVGRVERIEVAPDSKLVKVVLRIESGQTLDRDIVAQLKAVGITGSVFIELDRKTPDEPDRSPALSFPSEFPIVASRPSEISQILQGLDDIVNKVNKIDFAGITRQFQDDLKRIDQAIADANVKGLSASLEAALRGLRRITESERWEVILTSVEDTTKSLSTLMDKGDKTLEDVRGLIADNKDTVRSAVGDFRRAAENANTLLEKGTSLVTGSDETFAQLRKHLIVTSQNLEKASEKLDTLLELLNRQPSQLLFGDAPVPRPVEPDREKNP